MHLLPKRCGRVSVRRTQGRLLKHAGTGRSYTGLRVMVGHEPLRCLQVKELRTLRS